MMLSCRHQTKGGNAINHEKEQISPIMFFLQDNWKTFTNKNESNSTVDTGDNCGIQLIYRKGGDNFNVVLSGTPTEAA